MSLQSPRLRRKKGGRFVRLLLSAMVFLSGMSIVTSVAGEVRVQMGMEQFDWREYGKDGERLLREAGIRLAMGFEYSSRRPGEWRFFSLMARGYFGDVDYRGYLQYPEGRSTSYSTRTHYWGGIIEPRYTFRIHIPGSILLPTLSVGVGGEWWLRDLRGEYGYREKYEVAYARLEAGLESRRTTGWFVRTGVKSPFHLGERLSGFYLDGACEDVKLSPGKNDTVSFTVGYRFRGNATLSLDYDGYLFSASPKELVRCEKGARLEIHQPRSEMKTLSLRYSVALPEM